MVKLIHFIAASQIRHNFGSNDKRRDAGQTTPEDVIRWDNILYGDDTRFKKWQLLDVYRPKSASVADDPTNPAAPSATTNPADTINPSATPGSSLSKLPLIISVHGGAWVYGDKDKYQFYCMRLAQRGFAVINFSYRLAPEAKFPSSLIDTEKVFQWACDNAEKYGFDLNNVFAVGDSAGAHLLTIYASALTNAEYGNNYSFIQKKPLVIRGLALNCGKYNMEPTDSQMKLLLSGLLPQGGTAEEISMLNAESHVTKGFPPSYVMTCEGDFIKNQSDIINLALEKAGVAHEYHCYGTVEEPLWHVFHCDPKLEAAVRCNDDEMRFFNSLIVKN